MSRVRRLKNVGRYLIIRGSLVTMDTAGGTILGPKMDGTSAGHTRIVLKTTVR